MPFQFTILSDEFHSIADTAIRHLAIDEGLALKQFRIEQAFSDEVGFVPVAWANTRDGHYLCLEVGHNPHIISLDAFILQCKNASLPVKLYVAIPYGKDKSGDYAQEQKWAKDNGVGVLAIDHQTVSDLNSPLSISLTGLRSLRSWTIPARYKAAFKGAHYTFVNGDPVKGCSRVYDELESATRRLAKKALEKGWWHLKSGETIDIDKQQWHALLEMLMSRLQYGACKAMCPGLTKKLLTRVVALTDPRNESGHKLTKPYLVRNRDTRLRTRFEEGLDVFVDMLKGCGRLQL